MTGWTGPNGLEMSLIWSCRGRWILIEPIYLEKCGILQMGSVHIGLISKHLRVWLVGSGEELT